MAKQFTKNIFESTYRDDYKDSDNYYRILFNNGRALQARELTQLQTIIQSEMARMGRNLYKEGAAINPGGVTVNRAYEFIKLNTSINTLPANPDDLVGVIFTSDSSISVEVLEVVPAENSDPATLYVKYTNRSSGTSGSNPIRVAAGEELNGGGYVLTIQSTNTVSNPAVGVGTRASIHKGDFFTQGHFVFAEEQSKIISKYGTTPTVNIGFKVTQDIVTASDDEDLFDNSGSTPNRSSPGADRYRIKLTFATEDEINSDENFIQLAQIVDGVIASEVETGDEYNAILDVLATRTKEESGDYIVKPFTINFDTADSDTSVLEFKVSPGTAYVRGYRAATTFDTVIGVDKPRTTQIENNEVVAANYGNYVFASSGNRGIPNINTLELMNLNDAAAYGGSNIGTARVRAVEEDNLGYRIYLFDVQMNAGQNFRNVVSIGTSSTNYWNLILENNKAVLYDTTAQSNNLLFPLPKIRPASLSDISLTTQRRFTAVTDGSGNASISLSASGETFANTTDWIIGANDLRVDSDASVSGAGTASATISNAPVSDTIEILAYVNKSQGTVRTKTLTETTETITPDGSDNVTLSNVDVYEWVEIKDGSSSGADISFKYIRDNGQRDNYYGLGQLRLRAGQTAPSGDVYVKYKYFQHGAGGDFFAVNSYTGQVPYENIPSHTLADGTVINLRNVLDFRPSVNSSGTFGSGARINELPANTDLITADVSYYLPKAVRVVMNTGGIISVQEGDPSFNPQLPPLTNDTLELFRVRMNPYTLNDADIKTTVVDAKRYTMKDIGLIERRIDKLEEITSLSLLELETSSINVLDASGLNRTKSGFFVDNFVDQTRSDVRNREYRAAINPSKKFMTPRSAEKNIRLIYNASESSGVVKKGDNIYLNYSDQTYIKNEYITRSENVNPFAVVRKRGVLTLSPQSDEWKEVAYTADKVVDGGVRLVQDQSLLDENWIWNWAGITADELEEGLNGEGPTTEGGADLISEPGDVGDVVFSATGDPQPGIAGRDGFTAESTTVDFKVVGEETVRTLIEDRIVETSLIPYMRSKKVYFRAQGLTPNTRVFPFFDGKRVDAWCRQESFDFASNDSVDYGDEYKKATAHPDGSTNLVTDADGTVEGTFFIPATNSIKFRTGTRNFELYDISIRDLDACTSTALQPFVATGVLETRQRTYSSTREVTVGAEVETEWTENTRAGGFFAGVLGFLLLFDPLAQTFQVSEPEGVYVTGVKLRFETKDDTAPVFVQIRPTVNGVPSSNKIIPGTEVFKGSSSVSVSSDGSAVTTFEFDEPAYLNGGEEYAIVVLSDSNNYRVYTAAAGEFLLGSTERRLTRQATLGSLFKSQNGRTWTPDQTQDLTFELTKANFTSTSGYVVLENADMPKTALADNPLLVTNASGTVRVYHRNSGFIVGDTVTISGATDTGGISAANINGDRVITAVDGTGYEFTAGSSDTATSTTFGGGTNVKATHQIMMDRALPYVETLNPFGTFVTYQGKFTTGKSFAGSESEYVKDTTYSNIKNRENNNFNAPRLIASATNESANLGAGIKSASIKINLSTNSNNVSPLVDLQRASLAGFNYLIDKQISSATSGFNEPLEYVAETDPVGGSHLAKHVTKPVTLAESAVGLKVFLSANRPSAASFDVYYRTNGGDNTNLNTTSWTLIAPVDTIPSDENRNVYREYEYLIGGDAGTLDDFDQFQLKIVMKSTNSARVPRFRDLRIIALSE